MEYAAELEADRNFYRAQRISATRKQALGALYAEAHANPALWAWLTVARRDEVYEALAGVVTEPKPESEGPLDQRFFRTKMANVEAIRQEAEKLGVSVLVEPLPVTDILWSWRPGAGDSYTVEQRRAAARIAAQYAMLTFVAPRHEEKLIAVADLEGGQTTFHSLVEPSPWTLDMRRSFDFRRCDVCERRAERKRAYLVQARDRIMQVGGECAAKMDLTRRLAEMMKAFKALKKRLDEFEQMDRGETDPSLQPRPVFGLVWALVTRYGFVSRKQAEARNQQSTADQIMDVIYSKVENMERRRREYVIETRKMGNAIAETDIYDRVLAWAEERAERDGATELEWNMRSALIAPGPRRMGILAYAAEVARRDLGISMTGVNAPPHAYEPESIEEKIRQLDDKTADLLGLDDKTLARIRAGKLSKPVVNTLTRWIPGIWTIENVRDMDSAFGVTRLIVFERGDGARLKWFTSPDKKFVIPESERPADDEDDNEREDGVLKLETQTRWRILSATDGGLEEERLDRSGKPYPRARMISRAKLVAVGRAAYHPRKR